LGSEDGIVRTRDGKRLHPEAENRQPVCPFGIKLENQRPD
jgi:hypothetical protein